MVFVPLKKKEESLGFVPLRKQSIETDRLSPSDPAHGFIGNYQGKQIVQEAGTGSWYTMDEQGYTILPESEKAKIEESEIIKGGVEPTWFDPTMAIGAGAGMGARMAVKGVSKLLSKEAIKTGARAGAVAGVADIPAGIGAEMLVEEGYEEYALPFSILVGMGAEAGLRKILNARALKLGVSKEEVEDIVKQRLRLPTERGEQKLLEAPVTMEELKLLPEGQGFELVEKFEAMKRLGKAIPETAKEVKLKGEFVPLKPIKKVAEKPVIKPEVPKVVKPKEVVTPEKKVAEIEEIPSKIKEGEKLVEAKPIKKPSPKKVEAGRVLQKEKEVKPYSEGSSVKVGKSPQINTIIEELPATPAEKKLGERFFKVKNEKTGEIQEVTFEDIKPIKLKPTKPAEPKVEKIDRETIIKKGTTLYSGVPITPEALRHAFPAIIGSGFGFETDEEGKLSYNVAKGLTAAAAMYGYARIPYKGQTMAQRTTTKATRAMDKLFKTPYLKPFHPKAGLEEELFAIKKGAKTEERALRHKTFELTNKMIKSFSPEERAMISDVIEKEGDFLKASARVKEQAEIVRKWNQQIGDKLESLGLIDRSKLRVDKDKFIHRVYQKKVAGKVKYFGKSAMDRLRGGYTAPRGELKHIVVKKDWKAGDEIYSVLTENGKISYIRKAQYSPKDGNMMKKWKFEGIEDAGKLKGKAKLHRDYTRKEREAMGEVRDVAVRQGMYFQEVAHDMAFANMVKKLEASPKWVSGTPKEGWVLIPKTKVVGQLNKFGSLGGKYVDPEVKRLLNEVRVPWKNTGHKEWDAVFSGYRQAMGMWKLGKTALNPTVHFNNFVSNISMSFLDGRNPAKVVFDGAKSLKNKDKFFDEAVGHGLLDSNLIKGDIDVDNILSKLGNVKVENLNQSDWGKLMSSIFSPIKKATKAHIRAYEIEDEIFKLGVYRAERAKGLTPEKAMDKANELFFDYSDIPIGIQAIRDFGIVPFITYTYKAMPVVAKKYLEAPHRVAALYLGASALNAYSYRNLYGKDAMQQERSERGLLPEYMKGAGPPGIGFAPKSVRMPTTGEEGEATFLDISRIAPGGDILYQANPGYEYGLVLGQNPILLGAIALATNKDPYFGKKIRPFDKPISKAQKNENVIAEIKYLASQAFPNHPALPGSWSFNKIANAMVSEGLVNKELANRMGWTGKDFTGRKPDTAKAVLGSFGVKLRDVNPLEALQFQKKELMSDMKTATQYYRSIKGNKTATDYEKEQAKRVFDETKEEIKRVNEELKAFKKGLKKPIKGR